MEHEQKVEQIMYFTLDKRARFKGGDRYVCRSDHGFNIYFPQSISRPNGEEAKPQIKIRII